MTQQLFAWLDERLDLSGLQHFIAEKSVPVHKHSVWYYMGGITLFLVGVQVLTGILLLLYYRPSAGEAYESVKFIVSQVEFGWLIRNVHSWSANLLILMAFVHLFSTLFLRVLPQAARADVGDRRAAAVRHDGLRVQRLPAAVERAGVLRDEGGHRHRRRGAGRRRLPDALPARRRRCDGATLTRFYGIHVAMLPGDHDRASLGLHLLFIQRQGMSVPPSVEQRVKAGEKIRRCRSSRTTCCTT